MKISCSLCFTSCVHLQSDSLLMVRSMMAEFSLAQLHCTLANGIGSIDGGTLAAYVSFGVILFM